MDFLASGENIIIQKNPTKTTEEITNTITNLLDARIRPAIQKDQGDIKFITFEQGIVYVELQGHCVGCPYASHTLKDGVEKVLQTYIPEVKKVKDISEKV